LENADFAPVLVIEATAMTASYLAAGWVGVPAAVL
jgi:hypothetical protein